MAKTPSLHFGDMYALDKYSQSRIEKYASIIRKRLTNAGRVLDIGCYTAALFDLLPKAIKFIGLDFDEEAIDIAKSKGAEVYKCNLEEEQIEFEEKFDVIVVAEIFEHLKRPMELLGYVNSLLKDDGMLIVSLPNENTLYHRLMSLFGLGIDMCAFQDFKHLHLPTIRQSENFLKQHFQIMQKFYYVNPGAKGSRAEKIGWLFTLIPDFFWNALANALPGLFARGTIFTCKKING